MKSNFKSKAIEAGNYGKMIGKTNEEMAGVQIDFMGFISNQSPHNIVMAAEYALEKAETPEEAVIYCSLFTQLYAEATKNDPVSELKKLLGSLH